MPLNHSTAALLSPFLPLTQEVIFVDLVSDLERHEAYQKLAKANTEQASVFNSIKSERGKEATGEKFEASRS